MNAYSLSNSSVFLSELAWSVPNNHQIRYCMPKLCMFQQSHILDAYCSSQQTENTTIYALMLKADSDQ